MVLDHVAHEVLNDVALALLEKCLLHEFLDSHIVNHVLNIFFKEELRAGDFELLVAEPLAFVEGPLADHGLLAAAEALRGESHYTVAEVAEPERLAILDALDHLIFVVARVAPLVLSLVLLELLEVEFLEHALVEDEGLVVGQEHAADGCEGRCVATQIAKQSDEVVRGPHVLLRLLRLAEVNLIVAVPKV